MTPSITIRLESMLHGFRDVIMPAINSQEVLAVEQAGLIMAQLTMLLRQLPHSDPYNRLCQDDARETALAIVRAPAGGPRSRQAAEALANLAAKPGLDPHAGYLELAAGIAMLTRAVAADADPTWRARVNAGVLAFSTRQNRRERIWFLDAGFDPNSAGLPELKTFVLDPQA